MQEASHNAHNSSNRAEKHGKAAVASHPMAVSYRGKIITIILRVIQMVALNC